VRQALSGAPAEALAALCRASVKAEPNLEDGKWVTIDSIIGRRTIPAESAKVLKAALDLAVANDDVTDKSKFQALEFWAADYVAGVAAAEEA
jgi:hypothetical protein